MELTTLTIISLGEVMTYKEAFVRQTGEFKLEQDHNYMTHLYQLYPAVLLPIMLAPYLFTGGMRRGLCTDLMGSGSWILTLMTVGAADLCLQPARTTVPGVSDQSSFCNNYKHQQTN